MIAMTEKDSSTKIRIVKITDGTVIDHIRAGHALDVLQILKITGREGNIVSLAMNISSSRVETKDIVKIEDRYLKESEVAKIALVAPDATINIIRDSKVEKKIRVKLSDTITDVVTCTNNRCVTNKEREPINPRYQVVTKTPIKLKCDYCWTLIEEDDIIAQFAG
jgi:aspartate carbamoyltransferase regulatory subunit